MTAGYSVGGRTIRLDQPRVIVIGYAGRDADAVSRHIEELDRMGVPAPTEVPSVWELPPELLDQGTSVAVNGHATSGEAEPVLVIGDGHVAITVGSDHTDRDVERTSIEAAKLACSKVTATEAWSADEVGPRWDDLRLESDVLVDGAWRPYQRGFVRDLLPLDWYLDRFTSDGDAVVFCGTVPVIDGIDTTATAFRARLADRGKFLNCMYEIRTLEADGTS